MITHTIHNKSNELFIPEINPKLAFIALRNIYGIQHKRKLSYEV